MHIIDSIPLSLLIGLSLLLGLAPFVPEPHIVEKLRMLSQGSLERPIDIFDLFYHAAPLVLLVIKLIRLKNNGATR